jgi:hypothetical protein
LFIFLLVGTIHGDKTSKSLAFTESKRICNALQNKVAKSIDGEDSVCRRIPMTRQTVNQNGENGAALIPLTVWIAQMQVSRTTAWRWQQRGFLTLTNICGKLYVSREAREEFARRANAGDFSQKPITPHRKEETHATAAA